MFLNLIADKVLGPKDEVTGKRPDDPTGLASSVANMGDGMVAVAAAPQISNELLSGIRSGMDGLVSGGQTVASASPGHSMPAGERAVSGQSVSV